MNTQFTTELSVRPDDIDMYQHVHNSRYFDYVQAARHDQMERFYGMGMDEFHVLGLGFVVRRSEINFKRALVMGDQMLIHTQVTEISGADITVRFEIINRKKNKISCDGIMIYTMVNTKTGRSEWVTDDIKNRFSV